ncbi:MAG: hypothetical protein GF350_00185 [Chitinivibrionales bacterium]|nr:hypothetical protein [Chitinivibrionales bacterium]
MFHKRAGVAAILLLCASFAFAQNARRDALGGTSVIDDMVDILANPADMNNYVDAVQVTYDGSVGPAIGIKGVGDLLRVGLWYDNQTVVNSSILADFTATSNLTLDPIPHILLGMDLDAIQLGLDLYWERAIEKSKEEDTYDVTGTGTFGTRTTIAKEILSNPGFLLGINLPDVLDMSIWLGASLPSFKVFNSVEASGDTSYTDESTVKSKFPVVDITVGAEATLPISDYDLTAGINADIAAFGKTETEQTGTPDTSYETGSKRFFADLSLYTGVVKEIVEHNALAGIMAQGGLQIDRDAPDEITYNDRKTVDNTLSLDIMGGVEKEWDALKRLDAIQARCGLSYSVEQVINHESGDSSSYEYKYREKDAASRTGLAAFLGMGLTKSFFQFDLQIDPLATLNAFKLIQGTYNSAGNDFVKATVTVDFGGDSYGGSSDFSTSPPSYETTPSSTYDSSPSYESDTSTETSTDAGESDSSDEGFDF